MRARRPSTAQRQPGDADDRQRPDARAAGTPPRRRARRAARRAPPSARRHSGGVGSRTGPATARHPSSIAERAPTAVRQRAVTSTRGLRDVEDRWPAVAHASPGRSAGLAPRAASVLRAARSSGRRRQSPAVPDREGRRRAGGEHSPGRRGRRPSHRPGVRGERGRAGRAPAAGSCGCTAARTAAHGPSAVTGASEPNASGTPAAASAANAVQRAGARARRAGRRTCRPGRPTRRRTPAASRRSGPDAASRAGSRTYSACSMRCPAPTGRPEPLGGQFDGVEHLVDGGVADRVEARPAARPRCSARCARRRRRSSKRSMPRVSGRSVYGSCSAAVCEPSEPSQNRSPAAPTAPSSRAVVDAEQLAPVADDLGQRFVAAEREQPGEVVPRSRSPGRPSRARRRCRARRRGAARRAAASRAAPGASAPSAAVRAASWAARVSCPSGR